MRKCGITILLVLFCLLGLRPLLIADENPPPAWQVLFSEILLGTTESGSAEFIELFNTTEQSIDLTNWKIEYLTASATSWERPTRTINLNGLIEPSSYLLIASTAYDNSVSAIRYSSTLSQTGGHLRLLSKNSDNYYVEDLIAWGGAKLGLGDAVLAPDAGKGINRFKNTDEEYEPKLNNIDDFVISEIVTPLQDNLLPESEVLTVPEEETLPEEVLPSETNENNAEQAEASPKVYYPLEISEILPNPAEPQTDANDEFVEIYNPYTFEINLEGYHLTAGINASYKHTFKPEDIIGPGQYLVIKSQNSSLTLSNTAGKVALISDEGIVLSQTEQYGSAPEGQSWILHDGTWKWTATVTEATPNQYLTPIAVVKSSTKKTPTKKAKSTKAKSTVAKTKSASSTKSITPAENDSYLEEVAGPVNPLVLAAAAIIVVIYACYEYRGDIKNKFHQLRTYRTNRREAGVGIATSTNH